MIVEPPFKLKPSVSATVRYVSTAHGREHERVAQGRSTFVWLWYVLVPLAVPNAKRVEIRLSRNGGKWHEIRATPEQAYEAIAEFSSVSGRAIQRKVEAARAARAERS